MASSHLTAASRMVLAAHGAHWVPTSWLRQAELVRAVAKKLSL